MSKNPVNVTVERVINAPAQVLYDLVTDIERMGDWSPECTGGEWLGEADRAVEGARFKGTNTAGPNTWATKPTVTVAEPGREFAFKVPGGSGPTWTYRFDSVPGGTRVTESVVQTKRSPLPIRLLQKRAGITDRQADLEQNLATTLTNLARIAEAA